MKFTWEPYSFLFSHSKFTNTFPFIPNGILFLVVAFSSSTSLSKMTCGEFNAKLFMGEPYKKSGVFPVWRFFASESGKSHKLVCGDEFSLNLLGLIVYFISICEGP